MPYPNKLDIYDFKLAIQQSEIMYKTATKRKKFLDNKIKTTTNYFNKHKNEMLKFGCLITLVDKENNTTKTIDTREKKQDTTHEKYYKEDYEVFIKEIEKNINALWKNIDIENEIYICEKEFTTTKKLCAYIALKKKFEEYLNDIEIILKESNPQAYEKDKILHTEYLEIIESKITKLLHKKENNALLYWLKKILNTIKFKKIGIEIEPSKAMQ